MHSIYINLLIIHTTIPYVTASNCHPSIILILLYNNYFLVLPVWYPYVQNVNFTLDALTIFHQNTRNMYRVLLTNGSRRIYIL